MNIDLDVNGFKYNAFFSKNEINNIFIPILTHISSLKTKFNKRIIVFLAAPPATGKSTLSLFLENLSKNIDFINDIQALSLDGFHYNNSYLLNTKINIENKELSLYEIKGMPETYDLENFKNHLSNLKTKNIKWPIYDRKSHNPIMNAINVKSDIVLIEGNWLLLNEDKWRELKSLCNLSIFIEADEIILKTRLIKRKIRGGLTYDQALDFYERTDKKNINRVMKNRLSADYTFRLLESGELVKI